MSIRKQNQLNRILKYWLPAVVWAFIIFSFSSYPTGKSSEIHWQDFVIKKSAHVFVYSVLTILVYRAFVNTGFKEKFATKYTLISNVLYAISDEYHQGFTPGREPTLRDIAIDTFAIFLVLYIIKNLRRLPGFMNKLALKFEIIK